MRRAAAKESQVHSNKGTKNELVTEAMSLAKVSVRASPPPAIYTTCLSNS